MLSNNPYRKLVLDSFYRLRSTQMAYGHLAYEICLVDEHKLPDGFMDGETYNPEVYESINDEAVRRIGRFLKETMPITDVLYENNHFLDEEGDDYEDPLMPAYDGEADHHILLCVLLVYTEQDVSELVTLINALCELTGYPQLRDYAHAEFYEDENLRLIASFYIKVLEMFEEFKKEVMRVEDEKRNRQ